MEMADREIIINQRDGVVTARMNDIYGNLIKSDSVKTTENSKFSFEVGAKIAFDKMMKKDDYFKVGDSVRVKKDLVIGRTYGIVTFMEFLRHNNVMRIERITPNGEYYCVSNRNEKSFYYDFYYDYNMLEHAN